jgi:Domain of unknown function (DUF3854)/Domain of unknown function (DUF927)
MIHSDVQSAFHPDHWADLVKSGLTPETIQTLRIYSARPDDIPKLIGWVPEGLMSALVFPYPGTNGFCRVKVFPPLIDKCRHIVKYLQKRRSGVHLYVPPLAQSVLKDPTVPLAWSEGEKKAACACQAGLPCGGLGGLWNWLQDNRPIAELDEIAHVNRRETIYPDSDVWARPDLLKAVYAFGRELEARGATVRMGILPPLSGGTKCGLDDFLQEKGREALEQIAYITLKHKTFTGLDGWWRSWRQSSLHTSRHKEHKAPSSIHAQSPYRIQQGRLVYLAEQKAALRAATIEPVPIADFCARITEEITAEDGTRLFAIIGETVHKDPFTLEISAADFADERALKAALTKAAGARSPVRAGMSKHLGPAMQLLTGDDLRQVRRYDRTGWANGHFLMAGREPPQTAIMLPRKLPYMIRPEAHLSTGLEAFERLLSCMRTPQTTVAATIAFEGPLAALVGWRDERHGLFIKGRTGTLKTSWAQVLMCLYGPDFLRDSLLVKLGQGATTNAIMALATHAHDLPLLIDNYKPSTGGGSRDLINLIHNLLEGGEKDRLNRAAVLRETRPVFCWPIITGEDLPDTDPASLARLLVVSFTWAPGEPNAALADAQHQAMHLCAVGAAWLAWLESPDGRAIARDATALFPAFRAEWAKRLRKQRPDMVNILRVASNLASNQLTWQILQHHPAIGEIAKTYRQAHQVGLEAVAATMASYTAEALEASRYLATLRELIVSQRYLLLKKGESPTNESERDRMLGWRDTDASVYLLPVLAKAAVERTLGRDGLGGVSDKTLYLQLEALGILASKEKGRQTKLLKVGGERYRTLHLKASVLNEPEHTGYERAHEQ